MSRKPDETKAGSGNGTTERLERNGRIETGIDALNVLRVEMRTAGMTTCADALDETFALCLRDYMALKGREETPKQGANGSKEDTSN